jgi:hypothetical protein
MTSARRISRPTGGPGSRCWRTARGLASRYRRELALAGALVVTVALLGLIVGGGAVVALLDRVSQRDHSTGADDLVLVDETGDRLNAWTLRRHFYEALDAAGPWHLRDAEAPLRWHDLRHTFASHAVKAMDALSDVQALLGHAHITTTMRYVHHVPGMPETARPAERAEAAQRRVEVRLSEREYSMVQAAARSNDRSISAQARKILVRGPNRFRVPGTRQFEDFDEG